MLHKSGFHKLRRNAFAVVGNFDFFDATAEYFDFNASGACVYAVFNQLFYDRSRPLYHFAGRYKVENVRSQ